VLPLLVDVAFAPKNSKVGDVGLPPNKKFIRGLLQELMDIHPICHMASGVDSFRPKPL